MTIDELKTDMLIIQELLQRENEEMLQIKNIRTSQKQEAALKMKMSQCILKRE